MATVPELNQARRMERLRDAVSSKRMHRLGTEMAFEVLAKAKKLEAQGKSVVHLEIGEPDFNTPDHIVDKAVESLRNGVTHYTPAAGALNVRESIAKHVNKTRNVSVGPEHVVVTPGAKPIMFFVILACIEKGDEVIYPNPGYPIYESMIKFVGGNPVPLKLEEDKGFRFDEQQLRSLVTPKTKMIILNSPHNPTGGILTKKELEWIASISKENNLLVLADEIYDAIIYDGKKHESILSLPGMLEHTVLLAGFSKNYAMTGWRLGYGVMPLELVDMVTQLMINSNACTAAFVQQAGVAALEGPMDATDLMVKTWMERRNYIVDRLNAMGLKCRLPEGAFYIFCQAPSEKETLMTPHNFADYLLYEHGVAVLDGAYFGEYGSGYLRLSCATSMENLTEGLNRIEQGLKQAKQRQGVPQQYLIDASSSDEHQVKPKSPPLEWVTYNADGKKRVVVTKELPGTRWMEILQNANCRVDVCKTTRILTEKELLKAIGDRCDGVLGQLTEKWNDTLFRALKNAGGVVYANYAVGYDNVDVAAATSNGIQVGNTPGVLTETTAEMAVSLTFAAARRIAEADKFVREDRYKGWLPKLFVGNLLFRGTVGVIGAGRIGAAYARMMIEGHKMNLVYYDVVPNERLEKFVVSYSAFLEANGEKGVTVTRCASPEEVLQMANVVSLHTVLNDSTRHYLNARRLKMMKADAILINTSRGPVVDEVALLEHCKANPTFRAGLDVFEHEPALVPGLERQPNVVLAPHIASATLWTRSGMAALAASNIVGVLNDYPAWPAGQDVTPFVEGGNQPKATPSLVTKSKL